MTRTEAHVVAEALFRPYGVKDLDRIDAYVDYLVELKDMEIALRAVRGVNMTHTGGWPPTIGQVTEAYTIEARRAREAVPQLREPEMTEEERRENLRMAQDLVERFTVKSVPDAE
jgi:hypothetical protein